MGLNARAVGVKRAVYFGQALGFAIMSLLLIAFPAFILRSMSASLEVWLISLVAAVLTVIRSPGVVQGFRPRQGFYRRSLGDVLWRGLHAAVLGRWRAHQPDPAVVYRTLRAWGGAVEHSLGPESPAHHAGEQFHCLRLAGSAVLRRQFLAAGPLRPAGAWAGDDALAGLPSRLDGVGGDRPQDRGWPENSAAEKLPDVDGYEPDEPRRCFIVCLGCVGRLGVGGDGDGDGDGDQHTVGRDCGDSGVCVFQGTVGEGAGAGGCAGVGRGVCAALEGLRRNSTRFLRYLMDRGQRPAADYQLKISAVRALKARTF